MVNEFRNYTEDSNDADFGCEEGTSPARVPDSEARDDDDDNDGDDDNDNDEGDDNDNDDGGDNGGDDDDSGSDDSDGDYEESPEEDLEEKWIKPRRRVLSMRDRWS